MLFTFQNEIVAAIAIFIILIIYLIVKKINLQSKATIKSKDKIQEINLEAETQVAKIVPYNEKVELLNEDIQCSKKGDFSEKEIFLEPIEVILPKQKPEKLKPQVPTNKIKKRDIIKHGKITKQNFSEFAGERILVAEDNFINQKVLTGLLSGSGIEIIIANDGQEALNILEQDKDFLLILMDAHMPRVDGFQATRTIRENSDYDHILIVALSGDIASDDIKKMTEAGMDEHLEKPLRMETLYDIFYAYTHTDETLKENKEEYIKVIMTQELNGDKGLSICSGDEDFYKEILQEFINMYASSADELNILLNSNNIDKANQLLLDIIGVSANIGADRLNKITNNIKDTISDKKEKEHLTLVDQYKTHLENLIKDIKTYINF